MFCFSGGSFYKVLNCEGSDFSGLGGLAVDKFGSSNVIIITIFNKKTEERKTDTRKKRQKWVGIGNLFDQNV